MEKKYDLDLRKIGARLREVRLSLNKTIEMMHEISGFSSSLISAAEKGEKKPSAIYLAVLLDKFNVNLNYIISGRGAVFLEGPEYSAKGDDVYTELLMMMDKLDLVKFAMMSHYLIFKAQNQPIIEAVSKDIKLGQN